MLTQLIAVIVSLFVAAPLAQQPPAKERTSQREAKPGKPSSVSNREFQPTARRDRRGGRLLPADREEMQMERWVRMAVRTYGLDEAQEELVRNEVEKIQQERRGAMGDEAEEYRQLKLQRDAMYEAATQEQESEADLPASQRLAKQRDRRRTLRKNPDYQQIQRRMREIEQKHALDMDEYTQRIEQLLPEEQVRKAAEYRRRMEQRREQRRAEMEKVRESRRQRREAELRERREQSQPRVKAAVKEPGSPAETVAQPDNGKDSGTQVPQVDLKAAEAEAEAAQREAERQRAAAEAEAAHKAMAAAEARAKNMHPWERHVRDFIQQYELNPRQSNAAMSILQDSLKREDQYLRTYTPRIEAAKKIADKARQDAELAKLEQPRQYIFKEMTKRLDSLLTAGQRAKGKAATEKQKG